MSALRALAFLCLAAASADAVPASDASCDARYLDANASSFVCACSASRCDALPRLPPLPPGSYAWLQSDIQQFRFHRTEHPFLTEAAEDAADFTLSGETDKQTILGFGGAVTDSAALNVLKLSADTQENLLRSYFSEDGLEYSLVRINIGGCDFSSRGYTYLDTEGDVALETFSLQPEDLLMKIPVLQRAAAMSPDGFKIVGASWTAPAWMKHSNTLIHGRLMKKYYRPYAEYHIKFLEAYKSHNISIWGMSAQNEPLDGLIPFFTFNSMGWTPDSQMEFIGQHLGPLLHERGFEDTVLMTLDDQRFNLPAWPVRVFSDPVVSNYTAGIAVHWYFDDRVPPALLDRTHEALPDKFLLYTEACKGDKPDDKEVDLGSWERLEDYASNIIENLEHWVTGWIDWNIALDRQGGPNWCDNYVDSPIIINEDADEFYKNPMFYAMGHFSKFIRPGAQHLQTEALKGTELEFTAFRNTDGTSAIVLLNKFEAEKKVVIIIQGKGTIEETVAARSLNTFVFE